MYKDEMNYANKSKQERQEKGQFFTPELVLDKMFKYVKTTGTLLDNSMGSGNILAYAIQKRGFEPSKVYGIEFDSDIYDIAVERLTKLGVPKENLVLGDALSKDSYNEKHFDLAVINPPYKLGNKVAIEALSHSDSVVCLMPLSKYKKGKLWSKITEFSLADPKLFTDALINENLNVSVLSNTATPKFENENNLTLETYDSNYLEVYKYNLKHQSEVFIDNIRPNKASFEKKGINNKVWFATPLRAVNDGPHGETAGDYKWNFKQSTEEVLFKTGDDPFTTFHKMASEKAKDNLTKWWYYKGKTGLCNALLKGLKKDGGSCLDALPAIQWSNIENNPLWQEGKYDEAVLDMMGLKMTEGGKIVTKCI